MAQAMAEDGGRVPMSPGLQATLLRAREYAATQSEAQVLLEHLLLALTEDGDAASVLEACQIDLGRLRNDVAGYVGTLNDRVPPGTPGAPAISPQLTQVLKYATLAAQQGKRSSIDGAIVLAALVGDGRSMAASFLKAQGLTFEAAIQALREAAARAAAPPEARYAPQAAPPPPHYAQQYTHQAPPQQASPQQQPGAPLRADDILARARERVESRAQRTEPQAPRSAPRDDPPPAPPPQPPFEPMHAPAPPVAHSYANGADPGGYAQPAPPPDPERSPVLASEPIVEARDAPPAEMPPPIEPSTVSTEPSPRDSDETSPQDPGPAPSAAPTEAPMQPPRPVAERPPEFHWPPPSPQHSPPPIQAPTPPQPAGWAPPPTRAPMPPPAHSRPPLPPPAPSPGWTGPPQPPHGSWPPAHEPREPSNLPPSYGTPAVMPARQGGTLAPVGGTRRPAVDAAQISHSIPHRLKQGRPSVIEVRIERPSLANAGSPSRSYALRPETVVARAIAVRLRPLQGRFIIDAASPETQWDQSGAAGAGRLSSEAAVWRFTVTPVNAGRGVLQLGVSARTLGADGVLAETQLPDQAHEVRVTLSYGRVAQRAGILALVAIGSIVALKLVESLIGLDLYYLLKQLLRF
jgi:hypothetical protein